MRKFIILTTPIALLILIGMNVLFIKYSRDKYQDLQERRLEVAVNNAVDAAVDALVEGTSNLNTDYVDFERISVEPTVALDEFVEIFLDNYGMSQSRQNKSMVLTEYLPVFAVASYDGYYIAQPTQINEGGAIDTIFSAKQPYIYKNGANLYALNLGCADAKLYTNGVLSKVDAPISVAKQRQIISNLISDALMQTAFKQTGGKMLSTIYLPDKMTATVRTNPVEGVTVFAYVTGIDVGFGDLIDTFGIGGSRINHKRFVGCYLKEGKMVYAYMDKLPATVDVLETYESPELAASRGYYCDTTYLN